MLDLHLREIKENILGVVDHIVPRFVTPNHLTIIAFILGLFCCYETFLGDFYQATVYWVANRFFDGIDGIIARKRNLQSDFGGYLDIVCDFIVYSLIPIGVVYHQPSQDKYLWLALMEATYFVNAASLFFLSAIIERKNFGQSKKELTTLTMPPGLVEGTETMVFFTLFLIIPHYLVGYQLKYQLNKLGLYQIMTIGVAINIVQRLYWAWGKI